MEEPTNYGVIPEEEWDEYVIFVVQSRRRPDDHLAVQMGNDGDTRLGTFTAGYFNSLPQEMAQRFWWASIQHAKHMERLFPEVA